MGRSRFSKRAKGLTAAERAKRRGPTYAGCAPKVEPHGKQKARSRQALKSELRRLKERY